MILRSTNYIRNGEVSLSSMFPIRIPQCPPFHPRSWLIYCPNFTQCQDYWVKLGQYISQHSIYLSGSRIWSTWYQGWLCHPSLWSGTLNVLKVPSFLTPLSWHTSNWDISMKFSGYLPWSLSNSSIDCMVIGQKAQVMGQRPTKQPSARARMKGP